MGTRCSMRAAAWLVITDAPSTSRTSSAIHQPANLPAERAVAAMVRAASRITLPAMKKLAPATAEIPISAVAISTAEFTYRYSTCTMTSAIAAARNRRNNAPRTRSKLLSATSEVGRAIQKRNNKPPSNNDWKTSVPARNRTDR